MERVEVVIPNVGKIKKGDLDLNVSAGLVIRASLGAAIKIRQFVEDEFGKNALVYEMISAAPLFVVHFKDLSQNKQSEIEVRRKEYGKKRY